MNKFIGVGRLCQDPEVRYTSGGKAVASFSIAIDSGYGDNKKTEFVSIVAWEKLAEICGNNLRKGSRVLVEGRLQIRSYEAADGQKRRVAEIVAQSVEFLSSRQQMASNSTGNPDDPAKGFGTEIFDDEQIPF